jgi:hypothetical protein
VSECQHCLRQEPYSNFVHTGFRIKILGNPQFPMLENGCKAASRRAVRAFASAKVPNNSCANSGLEGRDGLSYLYWTCTIRDSLWDREVF